MNSSEEYCQWLVDLFLHLSLIPALVIIGVLSFLQRRTQSLDIDHRLPFLGGRFAIVVPLDSISSFSNRWSYGFAFGVVSYGIMQLFIGDYIPFTVPDWAKPLLYLIGAVEVGLVYFPFFACLSTPFRTAGAVMGIFYSVLWICITVWEVTICHADGIFAPLGGYENLIFQWPCLFSLIFILGRFVYILIKAIKIHLQLETEGPEELNHQHQMQHVKRLLRKTPTHSEPLSWFQRRVYEWDPHFKFPNRIIGTAIISLIGLYMMTLIIYCLHKLLFSGAVQMVTVIQPEKPGPKLKLVTEFISVAKNSWLVSNFLACVNSVVYIFHILVCYRKHLKRLWKGQRGFIPEKFHNPDSTVSMASIARYTGWQIAFIMWGFVISYIVYFLLAIALAYMLILPILRGEIQYLLSKLWFIVLTLGPVLGLWFLQLALVRIFFLQDKLSPTDTQKPLALNNRKAFHCFSYFFFFYNVVMGIGKCFLRLLFSLTIGTCLVSRIDRTIMQRGFERMDPGYTTWIGMIYADHYHNNPVMVCFCQLLVSGNMERLKNHSTYAYSLLSNISPGVRSRRRWLLFYTLVRNPHLILLRKQHLSSSSLLQTTSSPQSDMVVRTWVMASQTQSKESEPQPQITDTPAQDC